MYCTKTIRFRDRGCIRWIFHIMLISTPKSSTMKWLNHIHLSFSSWPVLCLLRMEIPLFNSRLTHFAVNESGGGLVKTKSASLSSTVSNTLLGDALKCLQASVASEVWCAIEAHCQHRIIWLNLSLRCFAILLEGVNVLTPARVDFQLQRQYERGSYVKRPKSTQEKVSRNAWWDCTTKLIWFKRTVWNDDSISAYCANK